MAKTISVIIASLIALAAIGYFVILGVGKPISTDLSVIGQGKPTLVLAYENFSPTGGDALNRLRKIKSDYVTRLNFAVADMGTPQGLMFAERYKLIDGQALFLNQTGQPIRVTNIVANEQELRSLLDTKLAAVE